MREGVVPLSRTVTSSLLASDPIAVIYDRGMTSNTSPKLPPLWLILLAGWVPVMLGVSIAASTVLGQRAALLNHTLFFCGYALATIPLGLAYHALWRRHATWKRSVPVMFALSLVVAFATTTLLMWAATRVGSIRGAFRWSYVFGSLDSVWFVLLAFCAMIMVVGYYVSMKEERHRATLATAMAREAELRALRYQLHPHFLFNTLNAISTLVVEQRTREATHMIARLGDFLRATLEGDGTHEVALADELALTEHYLDIEKARLGNRLVVQTHVGADSLAAAVPTLLLQPLVENAIRHGIAVRRNGGHLHIDVQRRGPQLQIRVHNDGVAADPPATARPGTDESAAIGLRNVRERLQQLYGDEHRFELTIAEDGHCQVSIDLPFRHATVSTAPDRQAQVS